MSTHPYMQQPDHAFWHRTVSRTPWRDLQFSAATPRFLTPASRIATAGSCFASNLMRYLPSLGLTPYFVEDAPDFYTDDEIREHGYREFSARYGNIYTVRQLRQLVEQALGLRGPIEALAEQDGKVFDLLRPHVRKGGFDSVAEARLDRHFHLSAVKRMLISSDVFVFTLGLTEGWMRAEDGAVFPVCPGTAAGRFIAGAHLPVNFEYPDILDDLEATIAMVGAVNPALRWIITVSPVHLVATHGEDSVIVASTYSKSVLRAVCGAAAARYAHVHYFPSYEIINSAASFGQYLESNLRDASERGIAHVMAEFKRVFVDQQAAPAQPHSAAAPAPVARTLTFAEQVARQVAAECDELKNDPRP